MSTWLETNQYALSQAISTVQNRLELYIDQQQAKGKEEPHNEPCEEAIATEPSPSSALETLCRLFKLSPFEREILLLCAGMEMDTSFASLCTQAQGNQVRAYPTFSLALAALSQPHWSALPPNAPLRKWQLIKVGNGSILTLCPLSVDERILHYLVGIQHLDERLKGMVEPVHSLGELVPSHHVHVERIVDAWSHAQAPIIQLCGNERTTKQLVAATACTNLGLQLFKLSALTLPTEVDDVEELQRLWEREALLRGSALLLDCDEMDAVDGITTRFIERLGVLCIVTSRERVRMLQRPTLTLVISKPTQKEQHTVWQNALGHVAHSLNGSMDILTSQFSLSVSTIQSAASEALTHHTQDELGKTLWEICRAQSRPRLDDLAQHIEPSASWDDLILPAQQRQTLREIVAHVRQRSTVYDTWGFAAKGTRGLGISALFYGNSGTGKTMAAEILANELHLDLYRIDLSQIVSKYIGETEKNLRRVFDAAEEGGVVLLFDEADALFGKRSEVKDSHDRYANIEVSYLLQLMEAYRGLAILTTNMKSALDSAFLRRIRFVVQFPFPDSVQRAAIWQRVFPGSTPTDGLDVAKLAQLTITGGNIRCIALNAAFLAADARRPVCMEHILQAARSEYAKLEKPLTDAEFRGWL